MGIFTPGAATSPDIDTGGGELGLCGAAAEAARARGGSSGGGDSDGGALRCRRRMICGGGGSGKEEGGGEEEGGGSRLSLTQKKWVWGELPTPIYRVDIMKLVSQEQFTRSGKKIHPPLSTREVKLMCLQK